MPLFLTLALTYCGFEAQWDGGTVGWGHNGMGAQWVGDTIEQGHNGIERDRDGDTIGLGHNGIEAQWAGPVERDQTDTEWLCKRERERERMDTSS